MSSTNSTNGRLRVCILLPIPWSEEFERLLQSSHVQLVSRQLESTLAPDLRSLSLPKATLFVVDAHSSPRGASALIGNILDHQNNARVLVVDENFKENDSYSLLRMGVKGTVYEFRGA